MRLDSKPNTTVAQTIQCSLVTHRQGLFDQLHFGRHQGRQRRVETGLSEALAGVDAEPDLGQGFAHGAQALFVLSVAVTRHRPCGHTHMHHGAAAEGAPGDADAFGEGPIRDDGLRAQGLFSGKAHAQGN